MANSYPHELSLGDVYFSPLLSVVTLAFLATILTVVVLNRLKISRYLYVPSYVFIAILTMYILLIDHFWIKF
jgi:hypothetical protein